MNTPKHSVSVAGVVIDESGRILVIQRRDNQHWEPPGGVLELDEDPYAGVCREVFEETGIRVVVDELSGVYKNMSRGVIALVFRCSPLSHNAQISDEASSVRWVFKDEIDNLMDPAYAVRIYDAFEPTTAVRSHDGVQISNFS